MANISEIPLPAYAPEPTPRLFHASDKFVRGIRGPLGSSKSSACVNELLIRSFEQKPWKDNVRRTRHAIIRRTFSEIETTTMATWKEWCPESVCPIKKSKPMTGRMIRNLDDGTQLDMEIIFLALDDEDDVDKLRSLELTMVWINEAKEILKTHLDMATGRVRRYPPARLGGRTFTGVIMDTNPPHDKHWWWNLAEEERPDNYEFFAQPPAVLEVPRKNDDEPRQFVPNRGQGAYPPAENICNLGETEEEGWQYYMDMLTGKDYEWIRVNLMGLYGRVLEGQPVYPEYKDEIHCAKAPLKVQRGLPLVIGLDLGLHPTAVFCQMSHLGQLRAIDELWSDDTGVRGFARDMLVPYVRNNYGGMMMTFVSDPAGKQRSETDESTALDILRECGIIGEMAPTNLFTPRREAVAYFLLQMRDGEPGFLLSPRCKRLRDACKGGYCYRLKRTSMGVTYSPRPDKYNIYTHISDALQYAALVIKGGYIQAPSGTGGYFQQASDIRAKEIIVPNSEGWT